MISLSLLRQTLQTSPEQEGELAVLRASVVALWEASTFRLWSERADHVEEIRPKTEASNLIRLELWPVETITLVEERACGESEWTELVAEDYALEHPNRLRRIDGSWAYEVRVTTDGGYVDDTAPGDILGALLVQAKFQQVRHGAEKVAVRGASLAGGGATFMEDAFQHPTFKKLAARHRRRV